MPNQCPNCLCLLLSNGRCAKCRPARHVLEPNNKRNRWRRCRNARRSYGWTPPTFREWLRGSSPDSYSAGPIDLTYTFPELLRG